jgi:tripartite-type tricarboxylate transporter receptor subunit TctC
MRLMIRAAIAIGLLGLLTLSIQSTHADTWPQRTVRLIVPLGAGSATDLTARLFAARLSARWGQPVIVDNRPGGDGIIALSSFVGANDDHTLLVSYNGPITVNPVTHSKLPYDPNTDLVPISLASDIFVAIAATESLKIGSLADLAARARREPGKLNWAPTPCGGYFVFAGFQKTADLPMVQVPYRDITQALGDLAEGRIHIMIASLAILMPQVHAGKVKLLAVTNQRRAPIAPEVPTVGEAGYPELLLNGFSGFFGSRNMPRGRRDRVSADIQAVANDPVLRDRLATAGQAARASTAEELATIIAEQRAHIERTAKVLGLSPI